MKNWTVWIGVLALAGCGGPETKEEAMQDAVDYFNRNGTSAIADQFEGVTVSARIDGDVVVTRIENFPSGTRTFDPNAVRKLFRAKLCDLSTSRNIIDLGGKIRVEMRSNYGKELPPVQVARCD